MIVSPLFVSWCCGGRANGVRRSTAQSSDQDTTIEATIMRSTFNAVLMQTVALLLEKELTCARTCIVPERLFALAI